MLTELLDKPTELCEKQADDASNAFFRKLYLKRKQEHDTTSPQTPPRPDVSGKTLDESQKHTEAYGTAEDLATTSIGENGDFAEAGEAGSARAYAAYLELKLTGLLFAANSRFPGLKNVDPQLKANIICQIRALTDHPSSDREHCTPFLFIQRCNDQEICNAADAAIDTVRKRRRALSIDAVVQWIESDVAVVRFEHPSLGVVEREFEAKALPPGAEAEDRFELAVELDVRGRVIAYQPMRDRLEKAAVPEWEKVPIPPPPENLDDREALARYDEAMTRYMARVTELQAPEVERWRAASRSK
jgi:hypothetical protein